jgi:hypothetical protein
MNDQQNILKILSTKNFVRPSVIVVVGVAGDDCLVGERRSVGLLYGLGGLEGSD